MGRRSIVVLLVARVGPCWISTSASSASVLAGWLTVLSSSARGRLSAGRLPAVDQLARLLGGGCPAGEDLQAVRGRAVLGCCVDEQGKPGLGRQFHGLEVKVEVADHGVVQLLVAGAVEAHV